ncbi:MAG: gamma-glutamyltransferase [Actinomycetota bacterium]|nr:gamma-glutamyltransferase [Actinomycetota bacterium]
MTAGIIAAGHDQVAEAGAEALRAGGNAFDAAVAAGFASAHCEPGFTSLAGGGFLLAHRSSGERTLFDFFVDTPGRGRAPGELRSHFEPVTVHFAAAHQTFHCGLGSVAVPGNLAGYLHVHRRLGRLPLTDVISPAAGLARNGVVIPATQAMDFALLSPILLRTPESRQIFAPAGRLLTTGDILRNLDLAAFLEHLGTDAATTLYVGELADRLADQMRGDDGAADGGLVTAADLAAYRVVERQPLAVRYRGRTVLTNPPPAFGGTLLALALSWLDAGPPMPPPGSPELAVELARLFADVDRHRAGDRLGRPQATRGTTQVSVVDTDGNQASMTTSNGECSGDVVAGTGILLNNMLGEDDLHPGGFHAAPPGTRVSSMMSPTIVLAADGRPELVLGSGGSKRIRSAILQVLVGVLDHGRELASAVDAPRLHWDTDHVEVEPGFEVEVIAALRSLAPINVWPDRSLYFGGVHAVAPGDADHPAVGAGDARRGGSVRVVSD